MKKNKELIGWIGAVSIVLAYGLLSLDFVSPDGIFYNGLNLLGGSSLAWRVYQDKNYSNFALELVFIGIAIFKLIQYVSIN